MGTPQKCISGSVPAADYYSVTNGLLRGDGAIFGRETPAALDGRRKTQRHAKRSLRWTGEVRRTKSSPISHLPSPISHLPSPISPLPSPISHLPSPVSRLPSPVSPSASHASFIYFLYFIISSLAI